MSTTGERNVVGLCRVIIIRGLFVMTATKHVLALAECAHAEGEH